MQGLTSEDIKAKVRRLGAALGFDAIGFARAEVGAETRQRLRDWLAAGRHGAMDYMARHASLREHPAELHAGTISVISVRLNYWPDAFPAEAALADASAGYVSRYALGRDYHKTLRQRLQQLAEQLGAELAQSAQLTGEAGQPASFRALVDSAPVLEVEFAQHAGLGWRGKHTLLLTREGSWHFLGEIYTDLVIEPDAPVSEHCGSCSACLTVCPTQAIVAPYQVDARRCISYLTIEHPGSIAEELRPLIGNRIYGCDDCQLCCPWNRFGQVTREVDFAVRHRLDHAPLTELFAWSEAEFNDRLAGSPIRRIGHERWLRNIAVALGNLRRASPDQASIEAALQSRRDDPSPLVREHVAWALAQAAEPTGTAPAACKVSGEPPGACPTGVPFGRKKSDATPL
jgi:epoxyqueuosine reductase